MKILLPQVAADEDDKEDRPPPGSPPSIVCGSRRGSHIKFPPKLLYSSVYVPMNCSSTTLSLSLSLPQHHHPWQLFLRSCTIIVSYPQQLLQCDWCRSAGRVIMNTPNHHFSLLSASCQLYSYNNVMYCIITGWTFCEKNIFENMWLQHTKMIPSG